MAAYRSHLTLLGQVTWRIKSLQRKRTATDMEALNEQW